jgi:hypothetical protein
MLLDIAVVVIQVIDIDAKNNQATKQTMHESNKETDKRSNKESIDASMPRLIRDELGKRTWSVLRLGFLGDGNGSEDASLEAPESSSTPNASSRCDSTHLWSPHAMPTIISITPSAHGVSITPV